MCKNVHLSVGCVVLCDYVELAAVPCRFAVSIFGVSATPGCSGNKVFQNIIVA